MVSQLRVFTIHTGSMDDFVKAWSAGVVPLRRRHGFTIDGAWVVKERHEFVWILSYDGPDDWESKEAAYYASAERAALHPNPAQYIAKAEKWFITPVLPRQGAH